MKNEHDWREAMQQINRIPAVYKLANEIKSTVFDVIDSEASQAHFKARIAAMQANEPVYGPFKPEVDAGLSEGELALMEHINSLDLQTFLNVCHRQLIGLGYEIATDAIQTIREAHQPAPKAAGSSMVELPHYEDESAPKTGSYRIECKGREFTLAFRGIGASAWKNQPEILQLLGIGHNVKSDGNIAFTQGLRVSKDDPQFYEPSVLALLTGIQNGVYPATEILSTGAEKQRGKLS